MRKKFIFALFFAITWSLLSIWIAEAWIIEVKETIGLIPMVLTIGGIAIIPGFIIFFMYFSMFVDKRENYNIEETKDTTLLIAAWNEELNILKPLEAIEKQKFKGKLEIIVIDDGSKDDTSKIAKNFIEKPRKFEYTLITLKENKGKSNALNKGLAQAKYDTIISMDADTTLGEELSLQRLATSLNEKYTAVAGTVISRNPNKNWITRIQEWDYLFGISIVKRIQSMYSGTLVCQGAFSAYKKKVLFEIGGWKNVVGEDIVLTWDMLNKGYKTYHNTEAICYTETPDSYRQFFHQRKRWSRGMIEAFRSNWKLLFKSRLSVIFIWYNLMFPFIDSVFAFIFIPAIIGAIFFSFYLLASRITLLVIPLSLLFTTILYFVQKKGINKVGLKMSKNYLGMILYVIFFQIIQTPATLAGYFSEIFKLKKNWGTKSNKIVTILTIILLSTTYSFSQELTTKSFLIGDSDKNFSNKTWIEYSNKIEKSTKLGINSGYLYLNDKFNNKVYYFIGTNIDKTINKNLSGALNIEQFINKEWTPTCYNLIIKIDSIENFHFEILSSRNILDVAKATSKKTSIYSNGLTCDYSILNENLVFVIGYINQQFSDKNQKNIYIGKIATSIKDILSIEMKIKIQRLNLFSENYFSPRKFDNYSFGIYKYFSIFNDTFLLKPKTGIGLQRINDEKKLFYYTGIELRGDINKNWNIKTGYDYSNAQNKYGAYGLFLTHFKLTYKF